MTNKFKFGDRVNVAFPHWHDADEIGVFLGSSRGVNNVQFENGGYTVHVPDEYLTPATDWVKCADKSPPFNTYVLIWDGEDQDVDWLSDTAPNEFKESHITHWMPLPAPPVEVER